MKHDCDNHMVELKWFPAVKLISSHIVALMSVVLVFSACPAFAGENLGEQKYKDIHINPIGLTPSRECGKCHKDIYSAWKNSLHAQAVSNPVFRAAYLQAFFADSLEAKRKCEILR